MEFLFSKFYLQKQGNEIKDYEDAFASKSKGKLCSQSICIAIADGATESSFAAEWAKMLTRAYAKRPFRNLEMLQMQTGMLSKRWQNFVQKKQLPWYAEEKVRFGAFSTLLGIEFSQDHNRSSNSGKWSTIAIGDSCLFHIRNDNLIEAFPISKSADFSNSPILLSSNPSKNVIVWEKVLLKSADWQTGDVFFLVTDALACWFLSNCEKNKNPWKILLEFSDNSNPTESFKTWLNEARESTHMKNDDVTLLLIKL